MFSSTFTLTPALKLLTLFSKFFTLTFLKCILYFTCVDILLLFFFCFTMWGCTFSSNFRYKVKYFFGFLLTASLLGFASSFDGCILLLLLTEFFILLLFFLIYLTNSRLNITQVSILISLKPYLFLCFLVYIFCVSLSLSGYSYQHFSFYESSLDVVTADFFLLFNFFFVTTPVLVVYCGLILSLFIIFFIAFYFQVKSMRIKNSEVGINVYLLRKQSPLKQAKHKAQVRTFKLCVPKR